MTKKEKMKILKYYFGSVMNNRARHNYVYMQKGDKIYELMLEFLKSQGIEAFKED